MGSSSDQYADETYRDDEYESPGYDDAPRADEGDERRFSYLPGLTWGGWPSIGWGGTDEGHAPPPSEEAYDESAHAEGSSSEGGLARLRDLGPIALLIVGGAILFVIPEPVTSSLGILLVGIGLLAWLADWVTG